MSFFATTPTREFDFGNAVKYSNDHPSLTTVVEQAKHVIATIQKHNPKWNDKGDNPVKARQWELLQISSIKRGVANAIEKKKAYYDNHWLGKITQFILKLFGMWHNGHTAAIQAAENFLLFWDTRAPLILTDKGYVTRMFFPLTDVSWVHEKLDTKDFFNYTPKRTITYDNGKTFPS